METIIIYKYDNVDALVLRYNSANVQPWVTHRHHIPDDSYYWGHYYENVDDAIKDFVKRCGGLLTISVVQKSVIEFLVARLKACQ